MKIIYYMPVLLKQQAALEDNKKLLDFCELFKVVSPNASIIDRTGGILNTPFDIELLYPIPEKKYLITSDSYDDTCMKRAIHLLKDGASITIFYSGGLDSTVVVLSFYAAIMAGYGNLDQITIAATPMAIIENPKLWGNIILPSFKLLTASDAIKTIGQEDYRTQKYVMGENADQLFGSDIVLNNMELHNKKISNDNIFDFLYSKNVNCMDLVLDIFTNLSNGCPVELISMADLIWWLNFSCKWQSVALRFLSFTQFLDIAKTKEDLTRFDTFFNTVEFQYLTLYGNLEKWGTIPSHYNYKMSSRKFIEKFQFLKEYAENKIKVPSLYRVLTTEGYTYSAIGLENNILKNVNSIKII